MKTIEVLYFALLRDKANKSKEVIKTNAENLKDLYSELNNKYEFNLPLEIIHAAVNDEYKNLEEKIMENDKIVFIPPVAGG